MISTKAQATTTLKKLGRHLPTPLTRLIFGWLLLVVFIMAQLPLITDQATAAVWHAHLTLAPPTAARIRITNPTPPDTLTRAQWTAYLAGYDQEWLTVHEKIMPADLNYHRGPTTIPWPGTQFDGLQWHLFAYSNAATSMTITHGRYPSPQTHQQGQQTIVEAALGTNTADQLGLTLGDQWHLANDDTLRFQLVGLVDARDPTAIQWEGQNPLRPFQLWRRVSFQPDFVEANAGLLLHEQIISRYFTPDRATLILIDPKAITARDIPTLATTWRRWQTQATTLTSSWDAPILPRLEALAQAQTNAAQTSAVLSAQLLLLLAYTLWLWGQMALRQEAEMIALWRARGFSRRRGLTIYGRRYALLALIAYPLGVFTAALTLQSPLNHAPIWRWGALGALTAWAVLCLQVAWGWQRPLHTTSGRRLHLAPNHSGHRLERTLFLGLIALGLGGWWQMRTATTLDPLLLLSPTFLMLGLALASQQLLPPLFALIGWLAQWSRGRLWPAILLLWGRDSGRAAQLVLIMSLAWGLILWSLVGQATIVRTGDAVAAYRNGAPLRLALDPTTVDPLLTTLNNNDTLTDWALIWSEAIITGPNQTPITLAAIDTPVLANRLTYPPNMPPITPRDWSDLMNTNANDPLPILISRAYPVGGTGTGDIITYTFTDPTTAATTPIDVQIMGLIDTFPNLPTPFALIDAHALHTRLNNSYRPTATYQLWLWPQDPTLTSDAFLASLTLPPDIPLPRELGTVQQFQANYSTHMLSQQMLALLRYQIPLLLALATLSLAGWRRLDQHQDQHQQQVWHALGVSAHQWARIQRGERLLLVTLGLTLGTLLGWLLLSLTTPLWALTLSDMLGPAPPLHIYWPYPTLITWLLITLSFYLSALWLGQKGKTSQ